MKKITLGLLFVVTSLLSQTFNVATSIEFRQALENSALNGEDDSIILAEGTYAITDNNLGTFEFNNSEDYDLIIESQESKNSLVVLNGDNSNLVISLKNTSGISTTTLKNITIINGANDSTRKGGGVYSNHNLVIEDCNISKNIAYGDIVNSSYSNAYGGGVYIDSANLKVINSDISNNIAGIRKEYTSTVDGSGGGVYIVGNIEVLNSSISDNNITGSANGSAIYVTKEANIDNSSIMNNDGNYAIYARGYDTYTNVANNAPILIYHSKINNNFGNGISVYGGNITVENSEISYNDGHGIIGYTSKRTLTILNSIFSHNEDAAFSADSKYAYIVNNIIDNNGQIGNKMIGNSDYWYDGQNFFIINNSFINNNGEIRTSGFFINNIIEGNETTLSFTDNATLYNNFIDYTKIKDTSWTVVKKNNLQEVINGSLNLENNSLLASSPAIDTGLNLDDSTFLDIFSSFSQSQIVIDTLKTDIYENNRIFNYTIDIGAIEYGSSLYTGTIPKLSISTTGDTKVYSYLNFNINISVESDRTITELLIDSGDGAYISSETNITSFSASFLTAGEKTVRVKVTDSENETNEQSLSFIVYDLTTQEAIEYGKDICINEPSNCGISSSANLTKNYVDSLQEGWHLLGTSSEIITTDTDLFNTSKLVWHYTNGQWYAYSMTLSNAIENAKINTLENIPQNGGFWILKE